MSKKRENRDPWAFASKRRLEARIGSKPVQQEFFERMNDYANFTDGFFNGPKGTPKRVGFVLLIFPFGGGEGHRTNYISNASRDDVKILLREQLAYFEGMPETTSGTKQ